MIEQSLYLGDFAPVLKREKLIVAMKSIIYKHHTSAERG